MSGTNDDRKRDAGRGGAAEDGRGGYLGFVAHEVRNPLSTALWSVELLARMAEEERGGARGEKLTAMCLRSLGRVRQLIEDHFLCERLDVGGIPLRVESVALRQMVDEIVSHRPPDAAPVTIDVDADLSVRADRALLERAIDSLIAAAGRDGTPVRVASKEAGGAAEVVVSGGPPGPDPFADPRKGTPGDPRGRALALPLARRAASALGGALAVEGGAFVLSLPGGAAYTARPDPAAHP